MTVIDSFLAFTARLGASERVAVEEALADLMESYESKYGFTAAEMAELDRRMSEASPAIASKDEVRRIFGHAFDQ
jgi:hypothetical protein